MGVEPRARLRRHRPADLALVGRAGVAVAAAELLLRFLSPGRCLGIVQGRRRILPWRWPVVPERVEAAVALADRLVPGTRSCLRRALAGALLLRGAGDRCRVVIGVRRLAGGLTAHAWVESGSGRRCGCAGPRRYRPLVPVKGWGRPPIAAGELP